MSYYEQRILKLNKSISRSVTILISFVELFNQRHQRNGFLHEKQIALVCTGSKFQVNVYNNDVRFL